jgi:uncharacterized membrane protein YccC
VKTKAIGSRTSPSNLKQIDPEKRMTRWAAPALYSLKTAIAALTALGIGLTVDLPMPFWAMTTVYITSNPISGATRSKAIYRALGTTLGAAFVAVVPALVEWPALLSLALAAGWGAACSSRCSDGPHAPMC